MTKKDTQKTAATAAEDKATVETAEAPASEKVVAPVGDAHNPTYEIRPVDPNLRVMADGRILTSEDGDQPEPLVDEAADAHVEDVEA